MDMNTWDEMPALKKTTHIYFNGILFIYKWQGQKIFIKEQKHNFLITILKFKDNVVIYVSFILISLMWTNKGQ